MPSLKVLYSKTEFTAVPTSTLVTVVLRKKMWVKPWLGFIDVTVARLIPGVLPCRIQAIAYSLDDHMESARVDLKEGEYIHGALTHLGVYGVAAEGVPRVIN